MPKTFRGMKKGENTPTAISLASGGMWARIGIAIQSIRPLGPGHTARITMHTANPAMPYMSRSRSSMRCCTKGCSVPARSSAES